MHSPLCNKCQKGTAAEGDSWCIGCSAVEHSQRVLRTAWHNPGLRRICEESLLSGARLARAFANLDQNLRVQSAPGTSAKAKADRSKSRGAGRPTSGHAERSRSRGREGDREERGREDRGEEQDYREPTGDTDASSYEESEHEEEEPRDHREERERDPPSPEKPRGSERPPEPRGPPPRRQEVQREQKREENQKKKKRRGGAKHQRRYREGDAEREELARSLDGRAPPTEAVEYDVEEAALWEHRHIAAGSVISFQMADEATGVDHGEVAVSVEDVVNQADGIHLTVRLAGAEDVGTRAKLQSEFRKGRNKVHICYIQDGQCPIWEEQAIHVRRFTWHPAGSFKRPWLTATGKKLVASGATLLGTLKGKGGRVPGRRRSAMKDVAEEEPPGRKEGVDLKARLRALSEAAGKRVTFAGDGTRAEGNSGVRAARPKAGAASPLAISNSAAAGAMVKTEPILVDSGGEELNTTGKLKTKKGEIGMRLAKLAQSKATKEPQTKRSRSRGRHRKRRRRRSSSRSGSDKSSKSESSSSRDLMPPLKKRSQKNPGSVLRMLEEQASEHLAKDGVLEEGETAAHLEGAKSLIYTYYQIGLRTTMDPRSRDAKEVAVLAKSLDLLREGQLAQLGDTLAGRLIAVETSTRQGWQTARHLEVHTGEDEGPVPAHILLAAQRHGRQVERAGGKGSWSRWDRSWPSGWQQEGSKKGKPKGKGKGSKYKGRNKGQWPYKGEKEKPEVAMGKKE
eukprot:Skav227291  [mRNA]  locus=scaffold4822:63704:66064:+ [translate_table: standard]